MFLDPQFVAQDALKAWQKNNHPWLKLSDVHKETTENIRITVIPFYMGCRVSQSSHVYWVRNYLNDICFTCLSIKLSFCYYIDLIIKMLFLLIIARI